MSTSRKPNGLEVIFVFFFSSRRRHTRFTSDWSSDVCSSDLKTLNLKSKDDGSLLEANWDVKMGGLAGMFTGMIKKHIRSGTEQAIESIKKQAENS